MPRPHCGRSPWSSRRWTISARACARKSSSTLPSLLPGWRWQRRDGLLLLISERLEAAGATHAFTTRIGGHSRSPFDALNLGRAVGDDPETVRENRGRALAAIGRRLDDHIEASQVHGAAAAVVDASHRGAKLRDVDILATGDPAVVLAMHCADCVPILLADPVRRGVAAVHTGWRGTAAGAARAAVAVLTRALGSRPEDLVAAIGPAIGPCCYEVDAPVVEQLRVWLWSERVLTPNGAGRWWLDLAMASRLQLAEAGVPAGAIAAAGLCTWHHPRLFFSHRRDPRTGRMAALVALSAPQPQGRTT